MNQKIQFVTNVPVRLCLSSIEGKPVESQFGGNQYLFTTTDGRVFYVSEAVGKILHDRIRKRGITQGDEVVVCKCESDLGRGRKSITWDIFPVSDAAEPPPAPKPVAVAQTAAQVQSQPLAWTDHLLATTNALTEVYSRALQHANSLQSGIRPDDVRSILLSAFINLSQKSKEQNRVAA